MKLINPTDDELNAAFAEHVAGWKVIIQSIIGSHYISRWCPPNTPDAFNLLALDTKPPSFTQSFDAVLPWLEKCSRYKIQKYEPSIIWVDVDAPDYGQSVESTIPRAIVVALLMAHGVEVEFTK